VWVLVCGTLEWLAREVESRLDASLWRFEEWMQILSPARYEVTGERRVLVIGPSEAREAFWPEPFRKLLGMRLINDSLSQSTFEDSLTQLEYIERVHGRDAIGEVLIVAVTPRLLQNYAPGDRPLPIVLNRYSPRFALDEQVEPQALVAKGPVASALARIRIAAHSTVRYKRALRALELAARSHFLGHDLAMLFRDYGLVSSRYYHSRPLDKAQYYRWVQTGSEIRPSLQYFFKLRHMNPHDQRTAVFRDFARLRQLAERTASRIVVVNLPEGGWTRRFFYEPDIHDAYMAVLHEAVGDLPLLDLRDMLTDDGFYDFMHPTWAGGLQISTTVATAIRELEGS
jgi:hypothetical protein